MRVNKYAFLCLICHLPVILWAQKTPEELGAIVFNVFKNKDYVALDTLTPGASAVMDFLRKNANETIVDDSAFKSKYLFHDKQFKDKCKKFIEDTVNFKVDWKNAVLSDVKFYQLGLKQKSDGMTKPHMENYLDVY